ncbi:putative cytochrome P450 [Nocardia brasiliensis NBRC 14402]|uniref:cytochrome P450 n=1 Tax=Nocardia brasiliensis TaxID=37326 RepID=UPI0002E8037F|nr:cytochrome P450 [Nocardia brasiliensis]ASF12340.1 cytochrome P450 [Nocardia brasiliensis]GAJ85136.1 putative cytochrome P450 [Nocardia brasiliensis NBRC 14402]SUB53292.1 Vitamin D(3) 25-hydroxylase [Nocardia brasiliensis]
MPLHYSPYDFAVHEDPYPAYARLRTEAPVYRNAADDFWALSRHADILAALRDSDRFSSANGSIRMEPAFWGPQAEQMFSFVAMDPPRHTRMRGLVVRAFTQHRVQALEPRLREIARGLLEPLLERGEFDLMTEFAGPYPTDVVSELVGVPERDREMIRKLGMEIMYSDEESTDLRPEAIQAIGALIGYYTELTIERSKDRRDDLLSGLLDAADGTDRLTPEEIVGVLILLVGAGIETTMLTLGNLWHAAWRHPDQRRKAFDGRIDDWIAEGMRYDPATQTALRTATEEFELHGTTVPAGARMLLLTGSANRDPAVFAEPDRFDLDRDTSAALVFGSGRHHCLGANLGQLELRVALSEIVGKIAEYEIDPAGVRRIHASNNRGFAALPTTVTAR